MGRNWTFGVLTILFNSLYDNYIMKKSSVHDHDTLRAFLAFMIVAVAAGVFFLFNTYSENIMQPDNFPTFMISVTTAMGLMVYLMYLVNKPCKERKAVVKSLSKASKKKKK
jgi:hypothetical protein